METHNHVRLFSGTAAVIMASRHDWFETLMDEWGGVFFFFFLNWSICYIANTPVVVVPRFVFFCWFFFFFFKLIDRWSSFVERRDLGDFIGVCIRSFVQCTPVSSHMTATTASMEESLIPPIHKHSPPSLPPTPPPPPPPLSCPPPL